MAIAATAEDPGAAGLPMQKPASYRIGYLNPFHEKAENQAFFSLKIAAERSGHQLVPVANSDEIIEADLDFVLAVYPGQPKTTDVPTFGAIHMPRRSLLDNASFFESLLTYDGYLTFTDRLERFLQAFCVGVGRPAQVGFFYHHTPQRDFLGCNVEKLAASGALRLCYFGTNWDRRDRPLFRALSRRPYMRIYGPEGAWDYLRGEGYFGAVPFDGRSVAKVYATYGAGLASLSEHHALDDVASSRVFEIASVGAVAVCADIPWIRKNFADTVAYFDPFAAADRMVEQIDAALDDIAGAPRRAAESAHAARAICEERFAAEIMLQNAVSYFEAWRVRQGAPSDPAGDPLIDVIVRVGGRPVETVLRAVRSIENQLAGRFRIVFVRYRPIELSEILDAEWQRIRGFEVVDCPNGGRAATMTAGLRAVKSRFFSILDDDDFWLNGHIGALLERLDQCAPERAFVFSGWLSVDEPPEGEPASRSERRRIGQMFPASDELEKIVARPPNCFLASSALLRFVDLDGWNMQTAEDWLLQIGLASHADIAFSYRATACYAQGSENASNFEAAPSRKEDLLECLLRSQQALYRVGNVNSVRSQLAVAMHEISAQQSETLRRAPATLVLEGNTVVHSIHAREDLERKEIALSAETVELAGRSRFEPQDGRTTVLIAPEPLPWVYGATLPLRRADLFPGPQWVVLEFAPVTHLLGAGILTRSNDGFQTRSEIPVSAVPVEIWLEVNDPDDVSGAVVQNWTEPTPAETVLLRAWIVREGEAG
jgi:hypothetical protein